MPQRRGFTLAVAWKGKSILRTFPEYVPEPVSALDRGRHPAAISLKGFMELTILGAIGIAISLLTVIGLIINTVVTVKTYKKSRRLEFLQRRDHLSQKISELNDRNIEAQLI